MVSRRLDRVEKKSIFNTTVWILKCMEILAWGFGGDRESSGRATLTKAVVGTGHESVLGVVG